MTTTAIRERPILFSAPMVNAILDGRKTMTRRIVKPQPEAVDVPEEGFVNCSPEGELMGRQRVQTSIDDYGVEWLDFPIRSPFVPGMQLWVREAWFCATGEPGPTLCHYRADNDLPEFRGLWKPSIHMPRWASRLTLELTNVRVERVQDISAKDILAEGVVLRSHHIEYLGKCPISAFDNACYPDLLSLWSAAWEKVNGKGSWEASPWVWVLEFRRVEQAR